MFDEIVIHFSRYQFSPEELNRLIYDGNAIIIECHVYDDGSAVYRLSYAMGMHEKILKNDKRKEGDAK